MRVLMLGWEFPPFIAGGLGTACYGLTKALDRLGQEVIFVLPRAIDRVHTGAGAGGHAAHVKLLSPEPRAAESSSRRVESFGIGSRTPTPASALSRSIQCRPLPSHASTMPPG